MGTSAWICIILSCIAIASGCHGRGGYRKKRSVNPAEELTVIGFFPTCINVQLNTTSNATTIDTWEGPVSLVVYHTRWYMEVNQTCWGLNDTVECWVQSAVNLIRGQSPTLLAVQNCVAEYYQLSNGMPAFVSNGGAQGLPSSLHVQGNQHNSPGFPNGTVFVDDSSCPTVSTSTYASRLRPSLNSTVSNNASDDVAFTLEHIDGVLEFAKLDLFCPNCTCDNLADANEYFENFQFNAGSCSSCWYTIFATSLTEDSPFRDLISQIAFDVGGFSLSESCPVDYSIDYSNQTVIEELLDIRFSCGEDDVVIIIRSCGLVQLGYRKTEEIYVTSPNDPIGTNHTIPDQCVSKIRKQTNKQETIINFGLQECNSVVSSNTTHMTYDFAVRNRPVNDLYANEIQLDRRVSLDLRLTCVKPLPQGVVGLESGIITVQRSISLNVAVSEQPLEATMIAYRDENFTVPFSSADNTVVVPDPIWIKVSLNDVEDIVIDVPTCWMKVLTQTVGEVTNFVILNGCPFKDNNEAGSRDGAHNLVTCRSNVASFMIYSSYFGQRPLHIYCDISIYEESKAECRRRVCGMPIEPGRTRRNVSGNLGLVIQPLIRECRGLKHPCQCDHICGCDSAGNLSCYCRDGYVLDADGRNCTLSHSRK